MCKPIGAVKSVGKLTGRLAARADRWKEGHLATGTAKWIAPIDQAQVMECGHIFSPNSNANYMIDSELVVMLSDNLERHRYVEPCDFVEISGCKSAILSTWRHMFRRAACIVVSLESGSMTVEQVKGLVASVRSVSAKLLHRNHFWTPLETFVVLGCDAMLYDIIAPIVPTLRDNRAIRIHRITGVLPFDRERLRIDCSAHSPATLGLYHAQIPGMVRQWLDQQRMG